MIVDNEIKLDYSDVLIVPRESELSSRSQVDLEVEHYGDSVVPIIAANMDGVGTFEMARKLANYKIMTALTKHYSLEDLVEFYAEKDSHYAFYSMGTNEDDYSKFVEFDRICRDNDYDKPIGICIDVANGYTRNFETFVSKMSENYPNYVLMVGNVVTPERTEKLIEAGADIVKIGIGPGSVCTTRRLAGVGYPQFSAVLECAAAADAAGGSIVADGGITCPGDAAKAFAAGAKYVMLGGYLAAHEEGLPEHHKDKSLYMSNVPFYGMASKAAQDLHNGGVAEYRASEGKEVILKYRGPVDNTIKELLGGIRSACTYVGAENISQLHRKTKFVKVNRVLNNVFGNAS
jgi:GMP reductase